MTGSDRPFRRLASGGDNDGQSASSLVAAEPEKGGTGAAPMILDPEFHQSIWRMWETVSDPLTSDGTLGPTDLEPPLDVTRSHFFHRGGAGAMLGALGIVVLGIALLFPAPRPTTYRSITPVVDMPTRPTVAWTAENGEHCAPLDEDHAILSRTGRVWSLDLQNGLTRWSVELSAPFSVVTCLSGADMVAITQESSTGTVLGITLLDGPTGRQVADLPRESTVQVVPMGSHLGLLGPDNTLRLVKPNRLDSPIWSRRLPGPPGRLDRILVHHIDDTTVQLTYSVIANPGEPSPLLSEILSVHSGRPPAWVDDAALAQAALNHRAFYSRVGDVILHSESAGHASRLVALNRQGRELWSQEDANATVVGSRLFLSSHESWGDGWSQLHEVNPLSGSPVNDKVFEQSYRYATAVAGSRLMIAQEYTLSILDEHMQTQSSIASSELRFLLQGSDQLFLGRDISDHSGAQKIRMIAIDADSFQEVWTLDLDWGERVEQLGRHLVFVDHDGETIHGLQSSQR